MTDNDLHYPHSDESYEQLRRRQRDLSNTTVGRRKNQSDRDFDLKLLQKGAPSFLIFLNFVMTFWIICAHAFLVYSIIYPNHLRERCVIPALESHFTDEEIVNIIGAESYPCTYRDDNYTKLVLETNYSYLEILDMLKDVTRFKRRHCSEVKFYIQFHPTDSLNRSHFFEPHYSSLAYYDVFCSHQMETFSLACSTHVSLVLFAFPIGVIVDLYGRKIGYLAGYFISVLAIVILYIPNEWSFVVGRLLLGDGFLQQMPFIILFVEKCNEKSRRLFGFLLFLGRPLMSSLVTFCLNDMEVYVIRIASALVVLITLMFVFWFVKESPRWLYYNGNQKAAWLQLVSSGELPSGFNKLPDKINTPSLRKHFYYYRKFIYKIRIVRMVCLMFASTSCFFFDINMLMPHDRNVHIANHNFLFHSFIFAINIVCYILMPYFTHRTLIIILYVILTLSNLTILVELQYAYIVEFAVAFGYSAQYLILYDTLGLFPTLQRGTAIGLALSLIGFANLVPLLLSESYKTKISVYYFFYMLTSSIICIILSVFSYDTRHLNLPDTYRETIAGEYSSSSVNT